MSAIRESSWSAFTVRSRLIRPPTISASPKTRFASAGSDTSITSSWETPSQQASRLNESDPID